MPPRAQVALVFDAVHAWGGGIGELLGVAASASSLWLFAAGVPVLRRH
jgi:hypothetical protein